MTLQMMLRDKLLQSIDWTESPLGPEGDWPESLSAVLNLCLASQLPTVVLWGHELIQFYNDAYCALFDGEVMTAQGQSAREQASLLEPAVAAPIDEVLSTGEARVVEDLQIQVPTRGGSDERYFAVSYSPLYDGSRVAGIFISMTDTTAKVLAERTYKELLSAVSHDLRSPLSTILVGTVLAERQCSVEDEARAVKKYTSAIRRSAERMTKVIGEIVDCANLASGQMAITLGTCSVRGLIDDALSVHEPVAKTRGLSLTVEVPDELPELSCDRERIMQVFHNVLASSLRHTPEGGQIRLSVEREGAAVFFRIHDTGSGARAGVGLSVAKGIVLTHGGRVENESVPGKGTTFAFSVPIAG
jgi:signal transduction histidine kinase